MSVALLDLRMFGSASMPDDDTPTGIGGAIDTSRKVGWESVGGLMQLVSSNTGDTTQTVTVSYLDGAGAVQTEVKTLNGQTVVNFTTNFLAILKAIKSATTAGDVAVESQTAVRANTAVSGGGDNHEIAQILKYVGATKTATVNKLWAGGDGAGTDQIVLDAGASAVDGFYNGMVVRMTNATKNFRIAKGMVFDVDPQPYDEIMEVRRAFYNASADAAGGSPRVFYDKVFWVNTHGSISLTVAKVQEILDSLGLVDFALETTLNGTGTNGGGNNRHVAPSSGVGTFDSADKNVTGGQLDPGDAQGVWLKLSLAAGAVPHDFPYVQRLAGQSI